VTPAQFALVQRLASGDFVSGEILGADMGISRAAIWKQLQQLQEYGLDVESVKGRGYRIPGGLDLLDKAAIADELGPQGRACLTTLHLEPVLDSTNSWLLRRLAAGTVTPGTACLAEQQSQGRGRRGRAWISPFGRNLYCSLGWEFEQGVAALEGLSLAVGVAAVSALGKLGLPGVSLKWPNDLLWHGRKLGGVLLEITGDASGVCQVVIGVGLNVSMPEPLAATIDQPWVNLAEIAGDGSLPSRSRLAGVLLDEIILMLCQFQQQGFAPFHVQWEVCNAHAGQHVTMVTPSAQIGGRVLGVNSRGGLRLQVDNREQIFLGGEISLRGES
jgi:BirA family biotin operon repressor/biotin-[acetyl-CoA-carboxylase] ligase